MTAFTAPRALSSRLPWTNPLFWFVAISLTHVVMRLLASSAVKWDEAEQILWTQELALGYGPQPPLYTWLQWAMNQVFGPSVLSLSLLKHALLALTYSFMYLAGRELLDKRGAFWASASMVLMPALGWYSVRDQTHTILVTAMACGAWWLLLRIVRHPRPLDFALLGLVCGFGMLGKYSFALVAGAMLLSALSVPEARRALLSRGCWWAPLVGLLVVLPHGVWLLSHLTEATAGTINKMDIQPENGLVKGMLRLLEGVVASTLLLWALFALWAFRSAWWQRPLVPASPALHRVFVRYLGLVLLVLAGMVVFGGVSNFKGRWILPLLCMAPLAAFSARPELQRHPRARRYTTAVAAMAVLLLLAAGIRPWFSGLRGQVDELNHPAIELADALRTAGYDGTSPIVASDHMLAGMLRLRFPAAMVDACAPGEDEIPTCVADHLRQSTQQGQGLLLISRTDYVPSSWWEQAQANIEPRAVQSISLPFHMVRTGTPPAHYEYIWSPRGTQP